MGHPLRSHGRVGCIPDLRGHFRGFSNLTLLEVYNLRGNFEHLADEFSAVLFECPGLKTLGLGVACTGHPFWTFVVLEGWDGKTTFFELMCERYALGKKQPLKLTVLRLGYYTALVKIPLTGSHTEEEARFRQSASLLEVLTDTSCLETLHLFNGGQALNDFDWSRPQVQYNFTWPPLRYISTRSLRQIATSDLGPFLPWLNSTGRCVTQLIINPLYGDISGNSREAAMRHMRDRRIFRHLSLPRLSLLHLLDSPMQIDLPRRGTRPNELYPLMPPVSFFLRDRGLRLTDLSISMPFKLHWVILLNDIL
jgi:hypothetical protein